MYPVDHIGIAVYSIDEALPLYRRTMGVEVDIREFVTSQGVEVAFLKLPNTMIELIAPTSPESKLQKFLDKRGPGFHHICYRVDNLEAELSRLKGLGMKLLDETPRPGAHHTRIAFIHPESFGGVLTELCEYPDPSR